MMLDIVQSQRHKPMVLFATQDQLLSTTIHWKCENRSCSGRARQYGSNPPST